MRLINPSVELITQEKGMEGIYKQIERVGRTCYKSEDKITENSAKPFVDRMVNSKHYAMLEHGTVYLAMPTPSITSLQPNPIWNKYYDNPFSKVFGLYTTKEGEFAAVTSNLRVLVENGWLDDLQYLCEPTDCHAKRICLKFITSIGVSREFNRHKQLCVA